MSGIVALLFTAMILGAFPLEKRFSFPTLRTSRKPIGCGLHSVEAALLDNGIRCHRIENIKSQHFRNECRKVKLRKLVRREALF